MSTYKVIQDIEAEDKLVGPLTLRQFIYAGICAFLLYLCFFAYTKGVAFMIAFFLPPALFTGFLAVPWHGDQPTEVWALAKIRFIMKPRVRIWDQSGAKELVTITVPKKIERNLTDGLSQTEVRSRLYALANTIDSRGWAVKNANLNVSTVSTPVYNQSDRIVDATMLPQNVSSVDVRADDDILDASANPIAQHFDTMINQAAVSQRQQLIEQMQAPIPQSPPVATPAPMPITNPAPVTPPQQADYWFMHQTAPVAGQSTFASSAVLSPGTPAQTTPYSTPQASLPTEEETALLERLKAEELNQVAPTDHMKHIKTPEQLAEEARMIAAEQARLAAEKSAEMARLQQKAQVTSEAHAAIMNLARNDDQDIATLARRARKEAHTDNDEVVISLH